MLMKTQDKKYIEMKAQIERKKVERMKANLHLLGEAPANKHTVFVDDEGARRDFSAADYFDTPAEFVGSSAHRPRRSQVEGGEPSEKRQKKGLGVVAPRGHKKKNRAAYRELEQRARRMADMEDAALRMDLEKAAMGKGRKRRVLKASQNAGKPLYKWKKERKR